MHAISGQELTPCIPKSPVRPKECVWDGLKYRFEIFLTFHGKTYTNAFPFNGLKHLSPTKSFHLQFSQDGLKLYCCWQESILVYLRVTASEELDFKGSQLGSSLRCYFEGS